ncbi:hypothetical protein [Phenylobacterium sp.]|uniref:hypothetical protein n=1 Tax=Phenylobacterium sp. TaxID=1871053 RepID=UPI003BACCDEA
MRLPQSRQRSRYLTFSRHGVFARPALTTGGEQSKSGSGLSTGVETGAISPGNTQGANSAR